MTSTIVRAAIHPGIGVARLGTSPTEVLLAPQVPVPPQRAVNASHDAEGRLKREAVQFRIYGYDAEGAVVAELTADKADKADIVWRAHVANAKAGWFKFRHAMDVPSLFDTVVERRNPDLTDPEARRGLVIDPGPREIAAGGASAPVRFDTGTFKGIAVHLGELQTDPQGRLLFLPGHGVSGSPSGAPPYVDTDTDAFGNAADWYDDIADGPVDAMVTIGGRAIPTTGAWVVSAPPNYAPDIKPWRTLYDLVSELYGEAGWTPKREAVSFQHDIYPLLARLNALQWTSKAFAAVFGHGAPFDFANPELIDRLCRIHGGKADLFRPLRTTIARSFRAACEDVTDPVDWPWLYGDSYGTAPLPSDANQLFSVAGERLRRLTLWGRGAFVADWDAGSIPPDQIDAYPLQEQPTILDQAALDHCAADAFHPGIELTWPMRRLSIYSAPFRIARATDDEPDYGPHLNVIRSLGPDGPLHGQFPGSLSRWMLLPWQIDTGGCLAGYDDSLVYDAPSFWPSRVPNNVLTEADYARAVDPSLSGEARRDAFTKRRSWFFPLNSGSTEWGARLVDAFGSMGVLEARPGIADDPEVPSVIYVETLPAALSNPGDFSFGAAMAGTHSASAADEQAQGAGFADDADRQAMRRMRFGR